MRCVQEELGLGWCTTASSEESGDWFLRSPYQIEFTTHIVGCLLLFMLCDFADSKSQAVKSVFRHQWLDLQDLWQMEKKKKLAFHFIISEGVGTMKGCGRLHPFSIITYHLSLFFSPISLAPSPKRMGTLEGEASSELNLDKSQCVILVLICDATQGQPVCSPALADCSTHAGLHFFYSGPPTQIFFFF